MKKILALAAGICLIFAFAACGGGSESEKPVNVAIDDIQIQTNFDGYDFSEIESYEDLDWGELSDSEKESFWNAIVNSGVYDSTHTFQDADSGAVFSVGVVDLTNAEGDDPVDTYIAGLVGMNSHEDSEGLMIGDAETTNALLLKYSPEYFGVDMEEGSLIDEFMIGCNEKVYDFIVVTPDGNPDSVAKALSEAITLPYEPETDEAE